MGKSTKATKRRKNTTKKSYQQFDEDNIKEDQHNTSSTCRNQGKKKNSHGHQYNNNNNNKNNNKKDKKDKKGTKEKKDDYTFRQKIEHNGEREIIEMTADGNCLFRSISDQIYGDYGQRHDAVRDEICNYLEANKDDFKVYLLLEGSGDNDDVCDFDEYVRQMRKDGEWGGDVEIVCAARLYKRAITIFSNVGAYNVNVDDYGDGNGNGECMTKNPNILLSYHDNMHYNSVHNLTNKDRNSNNNNNTLQKKRSSVIQSNCTSTSESQLSASSKGKKKKGKKSGSGSKHLGVVDDSKNTTKYSPSQSNGKMDHSAEDNVCINKETMNGENGDGGDGGKNEKEEQVTCEQKLNNSIENSTTSSKNQIVTIKRNDVCPCGSGLRYKKCCLAKEKSRIRLEKFREKHGLNNENNMDDGGCNDSISRTEIEGGFAVLNI